MKEHIQKSNWYYSGKKIHYFKKGDFYDEKSSLFPNTVPISFCKRAGGYSGISRDPMPSTKLAYLRCKFCIKLVEAN